MAESPRGVYQNVAGHAIQHPFGRAAYQHLAQPSAGDRTMGTAGALQRLRIPNRIGLIAPAMRDNVRMHNGRGAR